MEVVVELFLWFLLIVVVAAFGFFVVRHKDDFEELLRRDIVEGREEAKKFEDKTRSKLRKFDDDAREALTQKVKKIRSRRGK